jgi:hypothetical protein
MAVMNQGILGGLSGKIGNVVGSSWKGIPVLKTKPLSVANPRTAAQIAQRNSMSNAVYFAQQILSTGIKPLWDRFASKMSGYNEWIKANIAAFADIENVQVDDLVMSRGKMAGTEITLAQGSAGNEKVTIGWNPALTDAYQQSTDIAYGFVFNQRTKELIAFSSIVKRSNAQLEITSKKGFDLNDVPYAFLAFKRADGTVVSDSTSLQVEVLI